MASTKDIERFAQHIGGGPIGLIHHRPEPGASPTFCFANVAEKVSRDGGRAVTGWMFQLRRVEALNAEYLTAIHHAIWNAPDGTTVDVTPFHPETRHHPFTINGSVFFLVDHAALPLNINGAQASLPMRFFPLSDSPELAKHLRRLEADEKALCERIYDAAKAAPPGAKIDASGTIIV